MYDKELDFYVFTLQLYISTNVFLSKRDSYINKGRLLSTRSKYLRPTR